MSIKSHGYSRAPRPAFAAASLGLLLILLAAPTPSAAQTPSTQPSPTTETSAPGTRYEKTFQLSAPTKDALEAENVRFKLRALPPESGGDVSKRGRNWEIMIPSSSRDEARVYRDTFPAWATAAHYGYELRAEYLRDDIYILLLTALPGINGDAPPDAAQFQMAWVRKAQKWQRAGTATYSLLDGGSTLQIISPPRGNRLIRRRPNTSSNFCGTDTIKSKYSPIFEVYEPEKNAFLNRVNFDALLSGAKPLKSEPTDDTFNPPFLRTWSQWFAASSDRRSEDKEGAVIRPLELGDEKFDTVWMEGAEGLGRGEYVSAQLNDAVGLSSVRIVTGLGINEDSLAAFARPTQVLLALSDGSRFVVDLEHVDLDSVKAGHGVIVKLPEPIKTSCLSVMLLESTPGAPLKSQPSWAPETVAIAQITPYSSLHHENAEQTAKQIVARIAEEPDARVRARIAQMALALKTPLSDEVSRAVNEGTPIERKRIIALIGSLPSEQAASLLIEFLRQTDPGSPEYRAIKRGLASLQHHASPGLLKYLRENSIESSQKRVDLLRLIGRVAPPDDLHQLIADLGLGTDGERNERIRSISAGELAMVEPLLVHASEHPKSPVSYDAIQALNLIGHRLHFRDQGEIPRPELYKAILNAAEERRTRLRVLEVAKYFHVSGFIDLIRPTYLDSTDPMIRKSTVQALSRDPALEARDIIIKALKDESPDVRIAAIDALSERSDLPKDLSAVIEYSRVERWKPGLQKAFKILARSDAPESAQRFVTIFEEQPNSETALLAARALRRADGHLDAQVAANIISDTSIKGALRLEMLNLMGLDSSATGEGFLLELFRGQKWLELFADHKSQNIARQRVFMTLGRRRNPEARAKMLDLAINSTDFEVQKISLRALGFYKDIELLDALEEQLKTADSRLKPYIEQSIAMLERRRTLDSIQDGLKEVGDEMEDETSAFHPNKPTSDTAHTD